MSEKKISKKVLTQIKDQKIEPKTKADQEKMGIALKKLSDEDPTFKITTDSETMETIISGMGELHLDILVDRMKREFNVEANVGKPQVAYKETIKKETVKKEAVKNEVAKKESKDETVKKEVAKKETVKFDKSQNNQYRLIKLVTARQVDVGFYIPTRHVNESDYIFIYY